MSDLNLLSGLNEQVNQEKQRSLDQYLTSQILDSKSQFLCSKYGECRQSHSRGNFHEGQLHYVGRMYDHEYVGEPRRIVVVGQEYGEAVSRVSSDMRYHMLWESAHKHRFKAGSMFKSRNPHMRGIFSLLRLLFGIPLGVDYESEFVKLDEESVHLFDTFALVNYLLCSAIGHDGRARGLATQEMMGNCSHHFREALRILMPTTVIVQSNSFTTYVERAFDSQPVQCHEHVYRAKLGETNTWLVLFTHPSCYYPRNWGTNERMPYLLETVKPTIEWLLKQ